MRFLATLAALSMFSTPVLALESTSPSGVVELFTAQGCNSCPPADTAFEELAEKPDVLALSLHVDYWNYLGWNDTLASKQNTQRQYGYAASMGRPNVYTPQAVLNGRMDVNGADRHAIEAGLRALATKGQGMSVPVSASASGKEIDISIGEGGGAGDIVVAYFKRREVVKITRGENSGRTIPYYNSVTDFQTVGMWKGTAMSLKIPMSVMDGSEYDGCAVLLQQTGSNGEPGPILGAARLMSQPREK